MNELPIAIVRIPTLRESDRFLDFVGQYGYKFIGDLDPNFVWKNYGHQTAYRIVDNTHLLLYGRIGCCLALKDRALLPKDPFLLGCSVDEYIAYVTGADQTEETDIQFGSALAELL